MLYIKKQILFWIVLKKEDSMSFAYKELMQHCLHFPASILELSEQ